MSRVVTLMVVACPGAFVLAGPTAMIAALAAASRLGILVKNTKFIEALADVDTVVLDKTGTLTLGHLEVVAVRPSHGIGDTQILAAAAWCAAGSRHPVSRAIVRAALKAGLSSVEAPQVVEETHGRGVAATGENGQSLLGRGDWLREHHLEVPENPDHDGAVVWVAQNGTVLGCLLLADLPRPEARNAVNELRQLGFDRIVLLTGDRKEVANQVAAQLSIENVIADVLPEQKLQVVQQEKAAGRRVMVVGDGVNDALALACGDVGIAMGAMGSDVALQSADVALMTNDLNRLPMAIRLSRQTRDTISRNLLVGAGSSVLMIGLAAFGAVSPIAGAFLHNAGEIFVILNSARLLGFGRNRA
jgi:heavy metal translocating P-type ATPase